MNRYILIDLQENCISNLEKVDVDFEENEYQTGSVSCIDREDLISELLDLIKELIK